MQTIGRSQTRRRQMAPWKTKAAQAMRRTPTQAEALLWQRLRLKQLGTRWRQQALMLGYIVDFWCPARNLVVEVDGKIHLGRNDYDRRRDDALRRYGYRVMRVTNDEVLDDLDGVVARITAATAANPSTEAGPGSPS